jgi:hypothetical protein
MIEAFIQLELLSTRLDFELGGPRGELFILNVMTRYELKDLVTLNCYYLPGHYQIFNFVRLYLRHHQRESIH